MLLTFRAIRWHFTVAEDAGAAAAAPADAAADEHKEAEDAAAAAQNVQTKLNVQSLPIRAYLDQTVVPILLQGPFTCRRHRLCCCFARARARARVCRGARVRV